MQKVQADFNSRYFGLPWVFYAQTTSSHFQNLFSIQILKKIIMLTFIRNTNQNHNKTSLIIIRFCIEYPKLFDEVSHQGHLPFLGYRSSLAGRHEQTAPTQVMITLLPVMYTKPAQALYVTTLYKVVQDRAPAGVLQGSSLGPVLGVLEYDLNNVI